MMRGRILLGLTLALCGWFGGTLASPARAANVPPSVVMLPMRDGTLLATNIYLPASAGPWPVALSRTPYGRTDYRSSDGGFGTIPAPRFLKSGIALVVQDFRGVHDSQGTPGPDDDGWGEHQDGMDTVNWIRQQPWSNGKIATYGRSAAGAAGLQIAG